MDAFPDLKVESQSRPQSGAIAIGGRNVTTYFLRTVPVT
jgi:hypothetical protein